ncbi:hypothetical protein DYB28_003077 [Aphanomyces astaci]|uniref:DDE-1 domain-containing protein n=1 Tax=Aphanomyces astaci TaxID=112090 RepID=A0A9X8HAN5_APHAT|nr:hypothetical protein DYB28_003077 [Aphanomyces astaci]
MSVYQVATELGVARRTLRNWVTKRAQILAYRGNKKRMKLTPGGRPEVFPDPPGLLEFIHGLRDSERALTTIHMVTLRKSVDGRPCVEVLPAVLHDHVEEASVILVDNFDSHVSEASYKIINEELGSHLCPLPPNSTSMYQPLDVGVMAPLKRYLRELWLFEDIITGEDEDLFSLTARQKRLALIKRAVAAWEMVFTDAIRGSFEKALPQEPMD